MALNVPTQKCNFPGLLIQASKCYLFKFTLKSNRDFIQNSMVCATYLTMCENYLIRRKVFYLNTY